MYPASSARIPDGHLAAIALLKKKVHQGLPSSNPAVYLGFNVCKSTTVLGLRAAEHLERVRSRYTGKERDAESGNDYFGARYYASTMGRFMSPDWSAKEEPVPYATMNDPQSLNLYAYVRNNPLRGVDPDGHEYLITEPTEEDNSQSETNSSQSVADQQTAQQQEGDQTQTLTDAQDAAISNPNLQPGAHGAASHCSEATCQIAHAVGANTAPLGPSRGGFYQANKQVANLAQAASTSGSGWHATDLGSAQQLANQGQLVIIGWINPSGGSGHTVSVMSDPSNPHAATNPTVAQVGGSAGNGRMPFRNAFGADKRGQVQIYVYTGR